MNQRPLRPERKSDESQPLNIQSVAATAPDACTSACTSKTNPVNAAGVEADQVDPLKAIAAAISNLSSEDRERLSTMLSDKES